MKCLTINITDTVAMKEVNLQIIQELKGCMATIMSTPAYLQMVSTTEGAFTRTRKLPFDKLVLFILRLSKETLSHALDSFFEDMGAAHTATVSGFTQQRAKLDPLFFRCWNQVLTEAFFRMGGIHVKKWNGYRLVAVDGTNLTLVNTQNLREAFGGQINQYSFFVQAKALYWYDVLNGLVLDSELVPYTTGETTMAHRHLERVTGPDMIAIYDRNFCNYKMIALHLWQECERKFVIRGNENHNWIKAFVQGGQQEAIVHCAPTPQIKKQMHTAGYVVSANTQLKVRLLRIELGEGKVEVLATNLWENEGFLHKDFKWLYGQRWGVETEIGKEKNILQLGSFSGLTARSVAQDFYATVMASNLQALLIKPVQEEVSQQAARYRHPMKVNNNKSFGKIKKYLVPLFLSEDPATILDKLNGYFARDLLPVRPGRAYPRTVKNRHHACKHKTYTNYKSAC